MRVSGKSRNCRVFFKDCFGVSLKRDFYFLFIYFFLMTTFEVGESNAFSTKDTLYFLGGGNPMSLPLKSTTPKFMHLVDILFLKLIIQSNVTL